MLCKNHVSILITVFHGHMSDQCTSDETNWIIHPYVTRPIDQQLCFTFSLCLNIKKQQPWALISSASFRSFLQFPCPFNHPIPFYFLTYLEIFSFLPSFSPILSTWKCCCRPCQSFYHIADGQIVLQLGMIEVSQWHNSEYPVPPLQEKKNTTI